MQLLALIVLLSFISLTDGAGYFPRLPRVISELNEGLTIGWNAFVTLDTNEKLNHLLQQIEIPKMLLTELGPASTALYGKQPHKLLVIAFVSDDNKTERMQVDKIVKDLLTLLHFTHIMWIYNKADLHDLQKSAESHWLNGYMNCIYYVNDLLYTYDPGPSMKIRQLHDASEYCSQRFINDFKGYPLTFPITSTAPRCFRYTDPEGKIVYAGYYYRTLRIFMDLYNFQFREHPNKYGSYDLSGVSKAIRNKDIDFIATNFYQALDLAKSDVLLNNPVFILVPSPKPLKIKDYFFLPFRKYVWLLNTLSYFLSSFVLALLIYLRNSPRHFDLHKPFLYVINVFLNQPSIRMPTKHFIRRLFLFTLMVHGLLTTNFYMARLSSTLVTNMYEPKIETIEQFAKTDLKLLVVSEEGDYIWELPEMPSIILDRLQKTAMSEVYTAIRDLNTSYAYVVSWDKLSFILVQQMFLKHSQMHAIPSFLYSAQLYFTVRKELPYIHIFNQFLHNLSASGILMKLFRDVLREGIISGEIRFLQDHNPSQSHLPLGVDYFVEPLLVFIGGLVAALLTFLCEIVCWRFWGRK